MTRTHYKCKRCGNCCRVPGYVYITEKEVARISAHLGMTADAFTAAYTQVLPQRNGLTLIEKEDYACVFLTDEGLCAIQPVKPEQCRHFPDKWNYPGFRRICQAEEVREPDDANDACGKT